MIPRENVGHIFIFHFHLAPYSYGAEFCKTNTVYFSSESFKSWMSFMIVRK